MINIKRKVGLATTFAGILFFGLASGIQADAAEALTGNVDLKGYDATITTNAKGETLLTTKKGEYELTENSKIYSSKSLEIKLDNKNAAQIDSIYVKGTLEFVGAGELNAVSDGEVGIEATTHIRAFKNTKYGEGKVTGTGKNYGIRLQNEIQMDGGTLEGYGADFGIWSNNDIKPYKTAVLKGVSTNGTGIWAYRDIYAWKGATVIAEGLNCGGYSQIAHIQAEDAGSSITGISHNINSQYSALHAQKEMLRAYNGAVVREEYVKPDFSITRDVAVDVLQYSSVARNMKYMSNYTWSSDPTGVFYTENGLLGDIKQPFRNGTIKGERVETGTTANKTVGKKNEVTELKKNGVHQVLFSEAQADYTVPITLNHIFNEGTNYEVIFTQVIEVELDTLFVVDDNQYDFSFTEYMYLNADKSDFVVTDETVVNYYYMGELDPGWQPGDENK